MARIDEHNACPVCARPVQALYFAAQQLVDLVDQDKVGELGPVLIPARLQELRLAVRALAPFIEAHHANQNHLLSPDLASAREPKLAA